MLVVKNLSANAGDVKRWEFNPWVRKVSWGGHGKPFQYSCLENPMDRGAWWAAIYGVAKSRTRLKWLSIHACMCINKASSRSLWPFIGLRKEGHLLRSGRAGTRRRKFDLHGWASISAIGQSRLCIIQMPDGNPVQYSCLKNPMDRGAWLDTVHGVTKNQTKLSN